MISKVITGKTFYGACRYVCMDEKRALVLEKEGVRGHNYKLMAAGVVESGEWIDNSGSQRSPQIP